jgi:hypothetical protein
MKDKIPKTTWNHVIAVTSYPQRCSKIPLKDSYIFKHCFKDILESRPYKSNKNHPDVVAMCKITRKWTIIGHVTHGEYPGSIYQKLIIPQNIDVGQNSIIFDPIKPIDAKELGNAFLLYNFAHIKKLISYQQQLYLEAQEKFTQKKEMAETLKRNAKELKIIEKNTNSENLKKQIVELSNNKNYKSSYKKFNEEIEQDKLTIQNKEQNKLTIKNKEQNKLTIKNKEQNKLTIKNKEQNKLTIKNKEQNKLTPKNKLTIKNKEQNKLNPQKKEPLQLTYKIKNDNDNDNDIFN